jgi:hypothetical protein
VADTGLNFTYFRFCILAYLIVYRIVAPYRSENLFRKSDSALMCPAAAPLFGAIMKILITIPPQCPKSLSSFNDSPKFPLEQST